MSAAVTIESLDAPRIIALPRPRRRAFRHHYSCGVANVRAGWTYQSLKHYKQLRASHVCALERDLQWLKHLRALQTQFSLEQAAEAAYKELAICPETWAALESVLAKA